MNTEKFQIWITLKSESPEPGDILEIARTLENLGIDYFNVLGICMTFDQWCKFWEIIGKWSVKIPNPWQEELVYFGFPIKIIG